MAGIVFRVIIMKRVVFPIFSIIAGLCLFLGAATASPFWQRVENDVIGNGAAICKDDEATGNFFCFGLRCGKGAGTEFFVMLAGGYIEPGAPLGIAVDGQSIARLPLTVVEDSAEYTSPYLADQHIEIIEKLRGGRSLVITAGSEVDLPLIGAGPALDETLAACLR
ncbi:hypothetical protein [Pseudovibrio exalbescens]|uniref:Invasion associated locus B (IalB) protein n=2 Tax=Pseudovibrio exalbescens TaxID=197461 RepID=A0A1U7JH16_9HYPH|nr:hypothetical protein [Pseudovibrio exalbescens]OKL43982.1 hypothetical protein A3843_10340 [Pseudovibrio exalbescens]